MKKAFLLILALALAAGGLYFYTDGEILQGRLSSDLLQGEEVTSTSGLKIQSVNLITEEGESRIEATIGNTTETQLQSFNLKLYLDGELHTEESFNNITAYYGLNFPQAEDGIIRTPGSHEVKVCIEEPSAKETCSTKDIVIP